MNDDKSHPKHRLFFQEKKIDRYGNETLGYPMEVATVWPKGVDRVGDPVRWHVSPERLGEGHYTLRDNERTQTQQTNDADPFDQAGAQEQNRDPGLSR